MPQVNRTPIALLKSVDRMRDTLLLQHRELRARAARQQRAVVGLARHGQKLAREGGARRGRGKAEGQARSPLKLIEIHREDIASLPRCLSYLRGKPQRFIVFCDDLSFDADDTSYKSLKAVLEGGIEGRPGNVVFYATSNRRHLMPREMMENERATAINPGEAVEEKVSLSDRFGLWIGFHNCSQAEYLDMVTGYADALRLKLPPEKLARRSARMGDDARGAIGPRGLAIYPGFGGTAGPAAGLGSALAEGERMPLPTASGPNFYPPSVREKYGG